eukprot:4916285-Amphidinium_carterae.1
MTDGDVYEFHKANIHENRFTARAARCMPLAIVLGLLIVIGYSVFHSVTTLLWTTALLNAVVWWFLVSSSLFALLACFVGELPQPQHLDVEAASGESTSITHLIVIPNYEERAEILRQTLQALQEAKSSEGFIIVLANEAREEEAAKA